MGCSFQLLETSAYCSHIWSWSQTTVIKLSSIPLIAASLTAIAGSAAAAPAALRPVEKTSFEREVDIYGRGLRATTVCQKAVDAIPHCERAINLAGQAGERRVARRHQGELSVLHALERKNRKRTSYDPAKAGRDLDHIKKMEAAAKGTIDRLTSFTIPYPDKQQRQ